MPIYMYLLFQIIFTKKAAETLGKYFHMYLSVVNYTYYAKIHILHLCLNHCHVSLRAWRHHARCVVGRHATCRNINTSMKLRRVIV